MRSDELRFLRGREESGGPSPESSGAPVRTQDTATCTARCLWGVSECISSVSGDLICGAILDLYSRKIYSTLKRPLKRRFYFIYRATRATRGPALTHSSLRTALVISRHESPSLPWSLHLNPYSCPVYAHAGTCTCCVQHCMCAYVRSIPNTEDERP